MQDNPDVLQNLIGERQLSNTQRFTKQFISADVRDLLAFSGPFIFSRVIDISRTFITNAFLARLSDDSNAAGAIIASSQLIVVSVNCCSYATGILMGKVVRATTTETNSPYTLEERFSGIACGSFVFLCCSSIPLCVLFVYIKPLLLALKQKPDLVNITDDFYQGYIWGIPAVLGLSFMQQFVLGRGTQEDSRRVLRTVILNTLLTTLLSYFLAFGVGGFNGKGAEGLGHANSIASWFTLMILGLVISNTERYKHGLNPFSRSAIKQAPEVFQNILIIGGAISVRAGSELISLFITTLLLAPLGNDILSAEQVANQYLFIMVMPLFGLAQGTAIRIAPHVKTNNFPRIREITQASNTIGISISVIMATLIFAMPKELVSLFISTKNDRSLYITARNLLYINAAVQLPDVQKNIFGNTLNVMEDQLTPIATCLIVNVLLALGVGYLLTFQADMGAEGMFYARLLTTIGAAGILYKAFSNKINPLLTSSNDRYGLNCVQRLIGCKKQVPLLKNPIEEERSDAKYGSV